MADFTPRPYQVELMKISLEKNSIIFLPTGAGKTFIAVLVLRQMCEPLLKKYSEGGKITVMLVNSVALVDQHAKYVANHTNFQVGQYTGEMNLDFWNKYKWYEQYDKHQVLIMTSQILLNNITSNFIDLNKINLLIFDECHHGVNDHPMRNIMKAFNGLRDPPRVLGLTATLLNKNINAQKVLSEVEALETTFHGQVATVNGLLEVSGYSTNPTEDFVIYRKHYPTHVETIAISLIQRLKDVVTAFKEEAPTYTLIHLKPLKDTVGLRELSNMLAEVIVHIESFGVYGAIKASISYMIQIESLKRSCTDLNMFSLLTSIITNLSFIKEMLTNNLKIYDDEKDQIDKLSSSKILELINIFRDFPNKSKEELCAIIFTKRRFTAKILYHILEGLRKCNPEFSHIRPDYIVGYNNNPFNATRENLFIAKKNNQVIEAFRNKEINVIVSSSVLEEGVDMQKCTLVIRYDLPEDYRGYIQSKGRARHKASLYYMMVEKEEYPKFFKKYQAYQEVEQVLNTYLVGKNKERQEPSKKDINQMYTEDPLPPYYVAGNNSAFVDMNSAISLLCQYCSSLPSDIYTVYTPEWYIEDTVRLHKKLVRVIILLPVVSPLRDIIEGKYMVTIKDAKKAAALEACIRLHKIGELDDHLLPKKQMLREEDVQFLFKHYPKEKEPKAGFLSNRRLHHIQVPQCLKGSIRPNKYYLHIINLNVAYQKPTDINDSTMYDIYSSSTCYGLLTPNPVPCLCDFPIYVTLGTINVSIGVNQNEVLIENDDLLLIKHFHLTVFDGVLKSLQSFLIFDNSSEAETLLIVPVNKTNKAIDFEILRSKYVVKSILELTSDEKQQLEVTNETYLKKIVVPWYRDTSDYVVTEVCYNKNALSPFPNEDFGSYKDYFEEKHSRLILCPKLPLLLVKGITKRFNFIKPRGREATKRKRDKLYEEMSEHLLPELVVKQDFPADLWIQASFLPTIIHRTTYMLRLEELRCKIAAEAGLGKEHLNNQPALTLDEYLLRHNEVAEEPEENQDEDALPMKENDIKEKISPVPLHINKDFAAKVLEAEFPWKDIEEPVNILKSLDVTVMEIEHYEAFMKAGVEAEVDYTLRNDILNRPLAITFPSNFKPEKIALLENYFVDKGPTLKDFYGALTCAKADDIVNLERSETLGDSFLKLISSVYVTLNYPNFNEGKATELKGRLVSNKNLYYLARNKNLGGIMQFNKLSKEEWLPPAFKTPNELSAKILNKEISINNLYHFSFSEEEQLTSCLTKESLEMIEAEDESPDETEEASISNLAAFLKCQHIGDKYIADVVESMLGCYLQTCGFKGALKFLQWINFFPKSVKMEELLKQPSPDPVLNKNSTKRDILFHIPHWDMIENTLGYKFQDKAYLLQAVTHSSYVTNRITLSYERLEFLGDAILDFLITCYIYESCGKLDPGELTDLRSALVNNNTFASLVVRNGLHKHLLLINSTLQGHIDKFVEYSKCKNYEVDTDVMILLSEDELYLAEYVDVPKVLGDVFEALAGAIYLDSGKDLKVVWDVFYKLMWKEIELFSKDVPKNVVRLLFEKQGLYPEFKQSQKTSNNKTLVPLTFKLDGRSKTVYGCGTNKAMARRAAAKLALRCLDMGSK